MNLTLKFMMVMEAFYYAAPLIISFYFIVIIVISFYSVLKDFVKSSLMIGKKILY